MNYRIQLTLAAALLCLSLSAGATRIDWGDSSDAPSSPGLFVWNENASYFLGTLRWRELTAIVGEAGTLSNGFAYDDEPFSLFAGRDLGFGSWGIWSSAPSSQGSFDLFAAKCFLRLQCVAWGVKHTPETTGSTGGDPDPAPGSNGVLVPSPSGWIAWLAFSLLGFGLIYARLLRPTDQRGRESGEPKGGVYHQQAMSSHHRSDQTS